MKRKKLVTTIILLTLCIMSAAPHRAMDLARAETRTDLAVSTFGVSGRGVIVAILDRGIDWKNNDFRNDDGTPLIKYIFDLTDNTGANASERSQLGFSGIQFGSSGDKLVPADYDGDGRADVAVFRDGTWYLQQTTAGFTGVAFGESTDKPVPNAFVP